MHMFHDYADFFEHFALDAVAHGLPHLLAGGPDVAEVNILTVVAGTQRLRR